MASKPKRSRGGVMAGIDEIVEQQLKQYIDERGWRYIKGVQHGSKGGATPSAGWR